MPSQTFETIRAAIGKKQQVVAQYNGLRRVLLPFVLGRGRDGSENALFYQVGGESRGGLKDRHSGDNWRCYPLNQLVISETRDGEWFTPSNYDVHKQPCVVTVVAHV